MFTCMPAWSHKDDGIFRSLISEQLSGQWYLVFQDGGAPYGPVDIGEEHFQLGLWQAQHILYRL